MLLMIDNYDSFTFNLVQYLGELGEDVRVLRNDEIDLAGVEALAPERIVLSPGPCSPAEAGICVDLVRRFAGRVPILGVCLGHQAIGAALGGKVVRAQRLMHGKTSVIEHDGQGVYAGLPERVTVIRYHSLAIERESLPGRAGDHLHRGGRRDHGRAPPRPTPAPRRRSKACSSTPSRSSASTATPC